MKNRPLLASFGFGLLGSAITGLSFMTVFPTPPYYPITAIASIGIGLVVSALVYEIIR
jgi:hypothetical protein